MGRRYWLTITLLALFAAAGQWLLWLARERPDEQTFAGPPRSGYSLDDYSLTALDADGRRAFEISGPRLNRRGDDGSIYATSPSWLLVDGSGKLWHGRSAAAWVNRKGDFMRLEGAVWMEREAGPSEEPVEVLTRDLEAWPRTRKLATAAPATIRQPGSILRGTGLRADLDRKTLELLSNVHSTLQTRRSSRGADVP